MSIDLEYAIKKDIRNNPVVREIDREQKREFLRTLGVFTLMVGMLLFAGWQHYRVVWSGYSLEQLRRDQQEAASFNRLLRLEYEMDSRPAEIERRAIEELRMIRPGERDTVILERARAVSPRGHIVATAR
jgi:Cell division protein FtsL